MSKSEILLVCIGVNIASGIISAAAGDVWVTLFAAAAILYTAWLYQTSKEEVA